MAKFSGVWILDHDATESQRSLLRAMGRPEWQILVIDDADERFELSVFRDPTTSGVVMDKNVTIQLQGMVKLAANTLHKLSGITVEFDKVHYEHTLHADGSEAKHADDEKQFGPCTSKTTYQDHPTKVITVDWKLSTGLLNVKHYIDANDRLHEVLCFSAPNQPSITASKIYRRDSTPCESLDAYRRKRFPTIKF
jgi:hypothetical protein